MAKLNRYFKVNFKATDQVSGEKYVLLVDCVSLRKANQVEAFIRETIRKEGNDNFLYDLEIRDRLNNLIGGFGPVFHCEVAL